jgi:phosphoadenosine phosphosulfate reductase
VSETLELSCELSQELDEACARLDRADPNEIISWCIKRFSGDVALACSFQDAALLDMVVKLEPSIEVIFADTGFHFPETLAYLERLRQRYALNLVVTDPGLRPDEFPCGATRCCEMRKVAPMDKALRGHSAWITGLKRVDTPERAEARVIAWDPNRNMVKVNPVAAWADNDIEAYVTAHDLLRHPLSDQGYLSIGCAPTTIAVPEGSHPREGRWAGTDKTECGLHI